MGPSSGGGGAGGLQAPPLKPPLTPEEADEKRKRIEALRKRLKELQQQQAQQGLGNTLGIEPPLAAKKIRHAGPAMGQDRRTKRQKVEDMVKELNRAIDKARFTNCEEHWKEAKGIAEDLADTEPPEEDHPHGPHRRPEEEEDQLQRKEWLEIVRGINHPAFSGWLGRGPNRRRGGLDLNEIFEYYEQMRRRRRR
jgi:hypothetical protein